MERDGKSPECSIKVRGGGVEANEFEPCLRKTGDLGWRPMGHRGSTALGAPILGCPPFSPPYLRQGLGPAASTSLGNMVDILGSAPDFNQMLWGRRTDILCCHMPFGC